MITLTRREARVKEQEPRVPGEEGIWVFVLGDMVVFGLFFGTFMYSRACNPGLFAAGHAALSVPLGTLNTVLLLTSSLLVARGVVRAYGGRSGARWLFVGALCCGLGFVVVKAVEWTHLLVNGIGAGTSEYYSYYFIFTGIHLAHVVIGLIILGRLIALTNRSHVSAMQRQFFETGGVFWHMVDLLWVVLFALFYLVR